MVDSKEDNIRHYISPGCNRTIPGGSKFYEEVRKGFTMAGWIAQMPESGPSGLSNADGKKDCDRKPDDLTVGKSCD